MLRSLSWTDTFDLVADALTKGGIDRTMLAQAVKGRLCLLHKVNTKRGCAGVDETAVIYSHNDYTIAGKYNDTQRPRLKRSGAKVFLTWSRACPCTVCVSHSATGTLTPYPLEPKIRCIRCGLRL